MSNMTKQIIKVASEIAQNVSKNMRIVNDADGSGCRELDFLNMENRAFRAAVEVLSNHPLFAPDFAPIKIDMSTFKVIDDGLEDRLFRACEDIKNHFSKVGVMHTDKNGDHPNAFPVSCGDVVKFGTNQPAIDGFTAGKLYRVVGTSFDLITTTCNGEDYIDHYRHQFFRRFDPAPEPDVMLFNKAEIESGKLDGCKVWPEYCNVWLSPVDGKPHYVDPEGWIHARGYMPVEADTILTDRQYMAEFKVKKNKEGAIPAEAAFWRRLLRFKLA